MEISRELEDLKGSRNERIEKSAGADGRCAEESQ
jgi:hypothetical protein